MTEPLDLEELIDALGYLGYRVAFERKDGWIVCSVTGADAFTDAAPSVRAALNQVADKMFPSAAARMILSVARQRSTLPSPAPQLTARPAPIETPPEAPPPEERTEPVASVSVAPIEDAQDVRFEPQVDVRMDRTRDINRVEPRPEPRFELRPPIRPPAPPELSLSEARQMLEDAQEDWDRMEPEVAMMSADLQRMHIGAFIARIRAVEGRAEPAAAELAQRVVRRLSESARRWWPGSVRALQLNATPEEGFRDLVPSAMQVPRNWPDVWDQIQVRLAETMEKAGDSDGWRDVHLLNPAPRDTQPLIAEVTRLLEDLTGPLDRPPIKPADETPFETAREQLLRAAYLLRWTRGAEPDPERWSLAMGRMRWLSRAATKGVSRWSMVIEPTYVPEKNWAAMLGQDPEAARKKAARKAVFENAPRDAGNPEAVHKWLAEAFIYLSNPEIATVIAPVRDVILQMDEEGLDRSGRSRLRRLKTYLTEGVNEPEPETEEGKVEAPLPPSESPTERLVAAVAARTRGQRALFVSNRADPTLEERLKDDLGLEITWCDGSQRRVDAECESIARYSYDMVLMATGFGSHSTEAKIKQAASLAKIPYVSVNKGRPGACVRALARGLGVDRTLAA